MFSDTPTKISSDDDHKFTAAVWGWIAQKPDIEIRPSPSSVPQTTNSKATTLKERIDHSQVTPSSSCSDKSDLRLYATEEQVWRVITGHGVDHKLLPDREFECLSIIAASGPQGCLQPDVTKISGQDKRSVPKRTDNLCAKGYIVKENIISIGMRTTRLKLRKYARDVDQLHADAETNYAKEPSIEDQKVVSSEEWYDKTIHMIQENGGAIVLDDLRAGLGIRGEKWETRTFRRCWKRLVASGLLRQVRAKGENSNRFVKCLQLLREPKEADKLVFGISGEHIPASSAGNVVANTEEDPQVNDEEDDFDEEPLVEVRRPSERLPAQWTPSLPFNNVVFDIIDNASIRGISALELTARAMGSGWRKPLDEIMQRLTDHWAIAQPSHLRHFTIIRESGFSGRYSHYLYRSRGNFEKAVEAGNTAWEAVQSITKSGNAEKKGRGPEADLDRWGFPLVDPRNFPKNGRASFRDCQRLVARDAKKLQTAKRSLAEQIKPAKIPINKSPAERSITKSVQPKPATKLKDIGLNSLSKDATKVYNLKKTREAALERAAASYKTAAKKRAKSLARIEAKRNGLPYSDNRAREIELDLLACSKPGVYINPPAAKEIFLADGVRRGRPPKGLFVVIKSPKLRAFPWFVDDISRLKNGPTVLQSSSVQSDGALDRTDLPSEGKLAGTEDQMDLSEDDSSQQHGNEALSISRAAKSSVADRACIKRPLETSEADDMQRPIKKWARIQQSLTADQTPQESVAHTIPDNSVLNETNNTEIRDEVIESASATQADKSSSPFSSPHGTSATELAALPNLQLVEVDPRRISSSTLAKDAGKGITRIRRENIVMDIVRKSGGLFPGDREMWYPFITAWRKIHDNFPDRQTVEFTVTTLVAEARLLRMSFGFRTSGGTDKTGHILLEPNLDPRSLEVKELQQAIIDAHPRPYVPESVEVAPELQKSVEPYRSRDGTLSSPRKPRQTASEEQTADAAMRGKHQFPTSDLRVKRPETIIQLTSYDIPKNIPKPSDNSNRVKQRPTRPMQDLDTLRGWDPWANAWGARDSLDVKQPDALFREFDSVSFVTRADTRHVENRRGVFDSPHASAPFQEDIPRTTNLPNFPYHGPLSMSPPEALHAPTGTFGNINYAYNDVDKMSPQALIQSRLSTEQATVPLSSMSAGGAHAVELLDDADTEFFKTIDRVMRREITLVENGTEIRLQDSFLFLNLCVKKGLSHSEEHLAHGPFVFAPVKTDGLTFSGFNDSMPAIQHQEVASISNALSPTGPPSAIAAASKSTRSRTTYKSRKRSAEANIEPVLASSPSVIRGKRRRIEVDKLSIPSERLDDYEYDRLLICIALSRLLCHKPGNREYPWVFIQHAMGFKYDEKRLSQSWNQATRRRQGEAVVQLAVQNLEPLLLQAYEDGELPIIDFESPQSNDWPALVLWAEKQLLPLQRPKSRPQLVAEMHDLPRSRGHIQNRCALREAADCSDFDPDLWCDDTRDYLRTQTIMGHTFSTPLPDHTQNDYQEIIRDPDVDQNLILIKSIARSIAMTEEKHYDAAKAAQKIRSIGVKDLDRANNELLQSRTFAHVKANRIRPGRNYRISSYTFEQFSRWQCLTDEVELFHEINAARDEIIRHFMKHDKLDFNPNGSEAENLVLMNMVSQGQIDARPAPFVWQNGLDTLPPALSIWGWREDIFDQKGYQPEFPIEYVKCAAFQAGDGLKRNVSVPTRSAIFPGEPCPRVPFWIDIYGNVLMEAWAMVLRSMLHLLLFRPGSTPETMEKAFKTKLWAWEIRLALDWMEKVGIAERFGTVYGDAPGWKVGEWWYCAFAPGVTPT